MVRSVVGALLFCSLIVCFAAVPARANSGELLSFEGIGNLQAVGSFYNGGGLSSTPNYGVTFSSNFYGLLSIANGGAGNFAPNITSTPAIFVLGPNGSAATGTMNVTSGFVTGLNFFYTAGYTGTHTGTVTIWSGANGTGTVLATIQLSNNNSGCTSPAYCTWTAVGVSFSGTAHSVTFGGPANELGLSDITIGSSTTAVPEPSSIYLVASGLMLISGSRLRRFLGL